MTWLQWHVQMWRQLVRLKEGVQKLAYHLLHRAYLDSGAQALVPASQSWASAVPQTAAVRGAALMTALTDADELEGDAEASLLKGMNAQNHLDRAVTDALQQVCPLPEPTKVVHIAYTFVGSVGTSTSTAVDECI